MTRKPWTTPEQLAWLTARKSAFLEAFKNINAKKASEGFRLEVCKDFREKWPVPPVTKEEIEAADNVDEAKATKLKKYDAVRYYIGD
jgi:hypothetical protein